jgi:hypothetical protein
VAASTAISMVEQMFVDESFEMCSGVEFCKIHALNTLEPIPAAGYCAVATEFQWGPETTFQDMIHRTAFLGVFREREEAVRALVKYTVGNGFQFCNSQDHYELEQKNCNTEDRAKLIYDEFWRREFGYRRYYHAAMQFGCTLFESVSMICCVHCKCDKVVCIICS